MTASNNSEKKIFLGPSGWSYTDWKSVVYPRRLPRGCTQLSWIARYFNAVEINTSFYHIPNPKQCEKWLAQVEPFETFTFAVKLWQDFTHVRDDVNSRSLNHWHAAMEPLRRAGRLGCVLVQFPWSFKRTSQNTRYLEALTLSLAPDPLAIEVRHDSWNQEEFVDWLRDNRYAFCNIDQPLLHRCLPPTEHVTAPMIYVRLHGRNRQDWFRDDANVVDRYRYLYRKAELNEWVERLRRLIEKAEQVFVFANNHAEGRAAANALQIKSMLTEKRVEAPPTLVRRYPELREYANVPPTGLGPDPADAEQLSLF